MDEMNERERKWGEAFRSGEPSPADGEWAARRRALGAAIAQGRATSVRRRLRVWIPAAAAAAFLAGWAFQGLRPRDVQPPEDPVPENRSVETAAAPAPAALVETVAFAGVLASGFMEAVDGSVPLAGRLAEEAGRRWIADPLKGGAERVVDAVRADARAVVRDLVAWTGETRSF